MLNDIIGIYKITNNINGKIYIGQSIRIYTRYKAHLSCAFNSNNKEHNIPIHNAIRKYGIENFKLEILEECSKELLDIREQYWINYYKSTDKNIGYNLTYGGQNGRKIKCFSVLQYDLDGNLLKEWPNIWQAAKALNINENNIRSCCCGQKSAGGFQWKYKDDNREIQKYKRNTYYPGLELGRKQIPIIGKIEDKEYNFTSIKEAAQWLIDNHYTKSKLPSLCSRISTIKNSNHKCCGFYWITNQEGKTYTKHYNTNL